MLIAYSLENNYTQSQKMRNKNVNSLRNNYSYKKNSMLIADSLQNNYTKLEIRKENVYSLQKYLHEVIKQKRKKIHN